MTQVHLETYEWGIGPGQALGVIAGCNVLESFEETHHVAKGLVDACTALNLPYAFKASFDKANRSSIASFRGPGLKDGLDMLSSVKRTFNVPICTDVHEPAQAEAVAEVADIIQLPAFLCRQTDLVTAIAQAIVGQEADKIIHVKKAQFLAPWDCKNIISKIRETAPDAQIILCERGTSFGYNNLIVDPLAIYEMQSLGVPVSIDATHAAQLPGADPRTQGASTGGRRHGVPILARSAVAGGADAVFLEFHTDPDSALCDGPCCLPLSSAKKLLSELSDIRTITHKYS